MLSFIGDYTCKIDHKGRVVVPVALRKEMVAAGEEVYVARLNLHVECIDLYPKNEWLALVERLRTKLTPFNRRQAKFIREFFRGAVEIEPDGSGRILVPRKMLDLIGVEKDAVLVGQGSKIELWEVEKYNEESMNPEEFEAFTEEYF